VMASSAAIVDTPDPTRSKPLRDGDKPHKASDCALCLAEPSDGGAFECGSSSHRLKAS
jgi:hypothetical protein